jgi:general secretion pathway protein J
MSIRRLACSAGAQCTKRSVDDHATGSAPGYVEGRPVTRKAPHARAGFTLIELLVALAILALLSVLGYRAVSSLTDSEVRLTEEATRWRVLDQFFTRLEADMREALPRPARTEGGIEPAWVGNTTADGNAELRFSRAGAEFALEAGSAGQRIGYRFRDNAVEIVYWPYPDVSPAATPVSYVLASGISRFHIDYLDPAGGWRDRGPMRDDPPLPRAVRVELVLGSGETIERWLTLR